MIHDTVRWPRHGLAARRPQRPGRWPGPSTVQEEPSSADWTAASLPASCQKDVVVVQPASFVRTLLLVFEAAHHGLRVVL